MIYHGNDSSGIKWQCAKKDADAVCIEVICGEILIDEVYHRRLDCPHCSSMFQICSEHVPGLPLFASFCPWGMRCCS